MKKINLAISGCLGRMGQQLIKSSKNNNKFKLTALTENKACLLYTSPSPRDAHESRMPSSA